MDGQDIQLCIHYSGKYNKESGKILGWNEAIVGCVQGDIILTLLNVVLIKLPLHRDDYDMMFKMQLSLSLTEKFLHFIDCNKDVEVVFDKYVNGIMHMITK